MREILAKLVAGIMVLPITIWALILVWLDTRYERKAAFKRHEKRIMDMVNETYCVYRPKI